MMMLVVDLPHRQPQQRHELAVRDVRSSGGGHLSNRLVAAQPPA
jgi:hypothetical protein